MSGVRSTEAIETQEKLRKQKQRCQRDNFAKSLYTTKKSDKGLFSHFLQKNTDMLFKKKLNCLFSQSKEINIVLKVSQQKDGYLPT
jgi:hypothetical protein